MASSKLAKDDIILIFPGNFFKNTLRKLSKQKRAELRAQQEDELVYKGFTHVFWAFTKTDMSQTLSMITDQDEINALEVFHLVLTYAGLMQTNQETNNGQNSVRCIIQKMKFLCLFFFKDLFRIARVK